MACETGTIATDEASPRQLEQTRILCIARPPSFPPWQGGMKGGFRYAISENALGSLAGWWWHRTR